MYYIHVSHYLDVLYPGLVNSDNSLNELVPLSEHSNSPFVCGCGALGY